MSIPRPWWYAAGVGLVVAALLPWAAHQLRGGYQASCGLDGADISPAHAVWIVDLAGEETSFCSLSCAETWLELSKVRPRTIRVTDESTGKMLPADAAYFVRSLVVVHAPTRERRHIFGDLENARRHADDHYGRLLQGEQRPFARWLKSEMTNEDASNLERMTSNRNEN